MGGFADAPACIASRCQGVLPSSTGWTKVSRSATPPFVQRRLGPSPDGAHCPLCLLREASLESFGLVLAFSPFLQRLRALSQHKKHPARVGSPRLCFARSARVCWTKVCRVVQSFAASALPKPPRRNEELNLASLRDAGPGWPKILKIPCWLSTFISLLLGHLLIGTIGTLRYPWRYKKCLALMACLLKYYTSQGYPKGKPNPRPDGLSLESLVEAYNKMLSLSNGFSSI